MINRYVLNTGEALLLINYNHLSIQNYSDVLGEFVPSVCSRSPQYGSAFCHQHTEGLHSRGFKTTALREFLRHCGADPEKYTRDSQKLVDNVLTNLSKQLSSNKTASATDAQGTTSILDNVIRSGATAEIFHTEGEFESCNK